MPDNHNGWNEYQKLVLSELERHSNDLSEIRQELNTISAEIAMLKVKSGVWGLIGGLIPTAIALAFILLKN